MTKAKLARIEKHARKLFKTGYDFTPEQYEMVMEGFLAPFRKMLVDKKRKP